MHIDLRSSSTSSSTQHLTFSLTTDRPSTGSVSCTDCTKITASLAIVRQRNFSFYDSYDIFFSKKYRNQSQTELLNSNSAFSKSFEILRVFCNHRKKIFSLSCLSICETITEMSTQFSHFHTIRRNWKDNQNSSKDVKHYLKRFVVVHCVLIESLK